MYLLFRSNVPDTYLVNADCWAAFSKQEQIRKKGALFGQKKTSFQIQHGCLGSTLYLGHIMPAERDWWFACSLLLICLQRLLGGGCKKPPLSIRIFLKSDICIPPERLCRGGKKLYHLTWQQPSHICYTERDSQKSNFFFFFWRFPSLCNVAFQSKLEFEKSNFMFLFFWQNDEYNILFVSNNCTQRVVPFMIRAFKLIPKKSVGLNWLFTIV